ncbi:hypothetical protein SLS57_009045 [Botryosphaeria dothidea]
MSFTKSSRNVSVTSDFLLTAECKQFDGQHKRSFVQLDPVLGNADGSFHVEGRDFSKSAKDVHVKEESGSTFLHASLRRKDGTWQDTSFNLDVIVANRNGVLFIDKSTIQPPTGAVTYDELERLVEDCRRTANDLKKQIHEKLLEESHTASQSVNTAFKGIEQMQEALSDGGAYAHKEDFRPEAGHLGFLLKDATGQWSQMDDAVGTASQEIKEFQHTKLHDVLAELEAAEGKIAAEVDGTTLKQKEAKDHLQSLGEQIASGERESWDKRAHELEDTIKEASCLRDRLDGLQIGLESSLHTANQSSERCRKLRAEVGKLSDDLRSLEERIHDKKCKMTEYAQTLSEAETDGVTAFQYSQTLQEGREILEEVLRVREAFDPEKLQILLQI